MNDNDYWKNDKENYIFGIRTTLIDLHMEYKKVYNYYIRWLNRLTKSALNDQFLKLRNYFETQE